MFLLQNGKWMWFIDFFLGGERRMDKGLLDFLIKAKIATYASKGNNASVKPLMEGSRQLEFQDGDFFYRDIYFGMSYFIGQETVYHFGNPIWSMSYAGGVEKQYEIEFVQEVYAFLRKSMRMITSESPFRGPKEFIMEDFFYSDAHSGNLSQFVGEETITFRNKEVYRLNYSGGYIR